MILVNQKMHDEGYKLLRDGGFVGDYFLVPHYSELAARLLFSKTPKYEEEPKFSLRKLLRIPFSNELTGSVSTMILNGDEVPVNLYDRIRIRLENVSVTQRAGVTLDNQIIDEDRKLKKAFSYLATLRGIRVDTYLTKDGNFETGLGLDLIVKYGDIEKNGTGPIVEVDDENIFSGPPLHDISAFKTLKKGNGDLPIWVDDMTLV